MASGFFVLLDDIATLMNDVASMGKIAAKKTAGILGDDLAVNAEKSSGFISSREIPVLWAITKGSFLNKAIILPIAFLLSALVPASVIVILVVGGLYLAYEAAEKVLEYFIPHREAHENTLVEMTEEDLLKHEKVKVKSAIVTDFILSVEIVIIALGAVAEEPLLNQIMIVTVIAILATIGVYGIVALIVRMDDQGYHMIIQAQRNSQPMRKRTGALMVKAMPIVIKSIGFIGTIALLLVSGGIFVHYIPFIHDLLHSWPAMLAEFTTGLVVGFVVLLLVVLVKSLISKIKK
jgi:predicted DNA repair protein MutK